MPRALFPAAVLWSVLAASPAAAQLTIASTQPAMNAINVPRRTAVQVTFDRPVNRDTFTPADFSAFGEVTGPLTGALSFSRNDTTVSLAPARALSAGEMVTVSLSRRLRAADGSAIRSAGHAWQFTVAATGGTGSYCHLHTFSTRTTGPTRIYGGQASDLNRDGWADLTIVNEVSADLRVYPNSADGSGLFGPLHGAPTPIPPDSSPNRAADFNGDGFIDLVTSSHSTDQVAVAWGRGDGTFDAPTVIRVGLYPRGLAAFDVDADGDTDIVVANYLSGNVALLRNDGAGNFAAPTLFSTGGNGPYGLAAADMNGDGILDLVVGHVGAQTVAVLAGRGDGTFAPASSRGAGGRPWVIVCNDLNGDGHMDLTTANSSGSSSGSVMLGNGDGTLRAPFVAPTAGSTVGTDLADVDGDGDLDWILSCFGGRQWYLHLNDGAGAFVRAAVFDAPGSPACAIAFDFDNDHDIDLALLDEIADAVVLMENRGCAADCDCSGGLDVFDYLCFQNLYAAQGSFACDCDASTGTGRCDVFDFLCFQNAFDAGCP